jgi:tartrate-resistant acid phosphatase type 5
MKNIFYILSLFLIALSSCQKAKPTNPKLEAKDDAFYYFVIGDWGRAGDFNQDDVAKAMHESALILDPEFIVSTGDNFYPNGVASTADPHWQHSFENVYHYGSLWVDWYPVLGNHDYHGNPQAQIDYSAISQRWNLPSRYHTKVFSDDGIDIRLIFIDTNPLVKKYYKEAWDYADIAEQDTSAQLKWLDSVLANAKEPWKIVIGHHPVYSSSPKHGDTKELITILKPRFEKYGVQAYFCGHDHDLQHLRDGGGVDYVLSGAGSEIRESGKSQQTVFAQSVPGFAYVETTVDSLEIGFINNKGNKIYSFKRGQK